MRYDTEHKARTRSRILDEAAAAMRASGPHGVSVATVMSSAGLTVGGFYAHFASKDDLIAQAIGHMFDERYGRLMQLDSVESPKAALEMFVRAYLDPAHLRQPEKACPIPMLASEVPRLDLAARAAFQAGYERLIAVIEKLLELGNAENPQPLAQTILTQMVGSLVIARSLPDSASAASVLELTRNDVMRQVNHVTKKFG
ncbi:MULTISPECIES: TetR/AcrR family transcriptional regulator [unclassified Sphingomonas]|uniref:TetR/AcrR family transcriptional regulator n=1 Tax=unclassified Sphingomonas TaxID=196159 RepID=UPI0028661494|nr:MULTISPECIES: TetR/AcrR family transcriptional regulator [unclassified Sphingomonas]MDR6116524.1 TetR/AcrR family transcriptional repressor of nem operon [Sphingomonas sp. SORGH_AS_0789]MDR6149801.1 TetR/AcrR family transcriptional repressor of nem operon [Sphingomonas sp. SORGH_AS_0742]